MPSGGPGDDRGAVTVEAALALCSLVVVLALILVTVSTVVAQLRCVDAARQIAPGGAVVAVTVRGDEITARISARAVLPGVEVGAEAAAVREPGEP